MTSLWESVASSGAGVKGAFHGAGGSVALCRTRRRLLSRRTSCEALRGRSVLLALREQLSTAIALLELDGVARRLVLCTPDLSRADAWPRSRRARRITARTVGGACRHLDPSIAWSFSAVRCRSSERREVSATRMDSADLRHDRHPQARRCIALASLAGTLPRQPPDPDSVWSTFYDIRRYGGLQIYLRAVLSGCAAGAVEPGRVDRGFPGARRRARRDPHIRHSLALAPRAHERRGAAHCNPEYVRLSGEVADQVVLDQLRATYPDARIAHAFASTEAGVAFEVDDGLAGFPADFSNGGARRHRDESGGRHAAHPLAADRRTATSARRPAGLSERAMVTSTPAIWSSCKTAAITFAAAKAASSMSAA